MFRYICSLFFLLLCFGQIRYLKVQKINNKSVRYSLIDLKNKKWLNLNVVHDLKSGFIVEKNNKFGYLSKDGEYALDFVYDKFEVFHYNYTLTYYPIEKLIFQVEKSGEKGLINVKGDWIYKFIDKIVKFDSPIKDTILLKKGKYAKFINLKGDELYKSKKFIILINAINKFFVNKTYSKNESYIFVTEYDGFNGFIFDKKKLGFLRNDSSIKDLGIYKDLQFGYDPSRKYDFYSIPRIQGGIIRNRMGDEFLINLRMGEIFNWTKNIDIRHISFAGVYFIIDKREDNGEKIRKVINSKGQVVYTSKKNIKISSHYYDKDNLWRVSYFKTPTFNQAFTLILIHRNGNKLENYISIKNMVNGYLVEKRKKEYYLYSKELEKIKSLDKIRGLQLFSQQSPKFLLFRQKLYCWGILSSNKFEYILYNIEKDELMKLRDLQFPNKEKTFKGYHFDDLFIDFENRFILKFSKLDDNYKPKKDRKFKKKYKSVFFDKNFNYLMFINDNIYFKDGYFITQKNIYNLKGEKLNIKNMDSLNISLY